MRRVIGLLAMVCVLALAASASAARPTVDITKLQLTGSGLSVTLHCKAAPCKGALALTKVPAGKTSPKTVLAKGSYRIPANREKTVTSKLTPRGTALLTAILHGKGKPIPSKFVATVTGGATQSKT